MKKAARLTYIWQQALMVIMFVIGILGMLFNEDQAANAEYLFIFCLFFIGMSFKLYIFVLEVNS